MALERKGGLGRVPACRASYLYLLAEGVVTINHHRINLTARRPLNCLQGDGVGIGGQLRVVLNAGPRGGPKPKSFYKQRRWRPFTFARQGEAFTDGDHRCTSPGNQVRAAHHPPEA